MNESEIRGVFLTWPQEKQEKFFKWVKTLKKNYCILEEENTELKKAIQMVGDVHE